MRNFNWPAIEGSTSGASLTSPVYDIHNLAVFSLIIAITGTTVNVGYVCEVSNDNELWVTYDSATIAAAANSYKTYPKAADVNSFLGFAYMRFKFNDLGTGNNASVYAAISAKG